MRALLIAGSSSGCGKTTASLGLMRALVRRGLKVAPFKVGPDYIDPMFHERACGRRGSNLDLFLCGQALCEAILRRRASSFDVAVIEGAMGLFDGLGSGRVPFGSAADLALKLKVPVVLVFDADGMGQSAAALSKGYRDLEPSLPFAGALPSRVAGPGHADLLREALEGVGVRCFGWLRKRDDLTLPSAHLGLLIPPLQRELREKVEAMADLFEEVDLEGMLSCAAQVEEDRSLWEELVGRLLPFRGLRLAVGMDEAFSFYYVDALELFEEAGIELVPFSPLRDRGLPDGVDAVYLGGGFPEMFAEELSENVSMRESLRSALEGGLPGLFECGGMMYLAVEMEGMDGRLYPMVGFLPVRARMGDRLQDFGYVRAAGLGLELSAHNFHRSYLEELGRVERAFSVARARDGRRWEDGMVKVKALASYFHVHPCAALELFLLLFRGAFGEGPWGCWG